MKNSSGSSGRVLRLAALFSVGFAALVFAACGANSPTEPTQSDSMTDNMPMEGDGMPMEMDGHETSGDDGHGEGTVDPDAQVIEVTAVDLRFEPGALSVMAGEAFTVRLRNEGALEHDFTIEGFEDAGAAHAMAGGEAMNTFHLESHGEYMAYCTIPGHREAGMVVKVVAG